MPRLGRPFGNALARRTTRAGVGLSAGLLLVATYASPAAAESRTILDRGGLGDGRIGESGEFGDISQMRVTHGPRRLVVRMDVAVHPDVYKLYIDTDPRDRGPEFLALWVQGESAPYVRRVESFPGRPFQVGFPGRKRVTCPRVPSRFEDTRRSDVGVMSIANRCLGNPARVSLSLQTSQDFAVDDWAPAANRFSRPLARG